jgi:hypothetical protein
LITPTSTHRFALHAVLAALLRVERVGSHGRTPPPLPPAVKGHPWHLCTNPGHGVPPLLRHINTYLQNQAFDRTASLNGRNSHRPALPEVLLSRVPRPKAPALEGHRTHAADLEGHLTQSSFGGVPPATAHLEGYHPPPPQPRRAPRPKAVGLEAHRDPKPLLSRQAKAQSRSSQGIQRPKPLASRHSETQSCRSRTEHSATRC